MYKRQLLGLAFFLFIGSEFVIPSSKNVKNERKNVPLGMVLSLLIILLMQIWLSSEWDIMSDGKTLPAAHLRIFYTEILYWDMQVLCEMCIRDRRMRTDMPVSHFHMNFYPFRR